MLLYWKKGIYFGKTTEDGLKTLREMDINIRTISSFHYHILSFIKYMFMIILLPPILILLTVNILCKYVSKIVSIPINNYIKYF